jgi:hypothetical protein
LPRNWKSDVAGSIISRTGRPSAEAMIWPTRTVLTAWNVPIAAAAASQLDGSSADGEPSASNTVRAAAIASVNCPTLNATFRRGRRCSACPTSTPAPTATASTLGSTSSSEPVQIAAASE